MNLHDGAGCDKCGGEMKDLCTHSWIAHTYFKNKEEDYVLSKVYCPKCDKIKEI